MTLKEQPVPTETPVRYPQTIEEDAFFYYEQNNAFLRRTYHEVQVPNRVANGRLSIVLFLALMPISMTFLVLIGMGEYWLFGSWLASGLF